MERIVALLVALAVLAERAATRAFPIRWLVLVLLRRAEAVAAFLVEEATGCEWPCPENPGETGHAPADALLLAARLRMLAAILCALSASTAPSPGLVAGLRCPAQCLPATQPLLLLLAIPGRRAAIRFDTS